MSFTTPGTTFIPDDTEVTQAERDAFMEALGAAKDEDLTTAQTTADAAQDAADAAQVTANAACPDSEAVKNSGAQTVGGYKTFTGRMTYTATGDEEDVEPLSIPSMREVTAEINDPAPDSSWQTGSLSGDLSGSVKYRIDRWGYFEIIGDITTLIQSTSIDLFLLGSAYMVDYDTSHTIDSDGSRLFVKDTGVVRLQDSTLSSNYTFYVRILQTSPL